VRGTQLVCLEDMTGDEGDDDYLDRHVATRNAKPRGDAAGPAHARGLVEAIKNLPDASST